MTTQRTQTIFTSTNGNNIIFNIVTDNYSEITRLVTRENVNSIIDTKNKLTALHYAIKLNNDKMIKYFLSLDAEPNIKTGDGQDAFDLSVKNQNKIIYESELKQKSDVITDQSKSIRNLRTSLTDSENNNKYLIQKMDDSNNKSNILKKENNDLKIELSSTKKDLSTVKSDYSKVSQSLNDANINLSNLKVNYSNLKKEYDILDNENKNLKRKIEEDEDSYNGLLQSIKKKK